MGQAIFLALPILTHLVLAATLGGFYSDFTDGGTIT